MKLKTLCLTLGLLALTQVAFGRTTFGSPSKGTSSPRVSSPKVSSPPARAIFSQSPKAVVTPQRVAAPVQQPTPQRVATPIQSVAPQRVATPAHQQAPQKIATPVAPTPVAQPIRVKTPTYQQPLTRAPNWATPNYRYRFRNQQYNSGYRYVPVYCERSGVDLLTGALAGAIVTQMILNNGYRHPVYADGMGGAYVVQNNVRVGLVQDENGNWVQTIPLQEQVIQPAYNPQPVREVVVRPAPVQQPSKPWGPVAWIVLFTGLATVGFVSWRVINYYRFNP